MAENRSFGKKSDVFIIGALLLLCALGYAYFLSGQSGNAEEANFAVLTVRDEIVATFNLGDYQGEAQLDLSQYHFPGRLDFKDGAVRFVDVSCPDKICESVGFIKNELESAICLPNRGALMIYTPEEFKNLRS